MDSALRLLSEWSMRSWSDVSIMKIKKVSARKSPILLVIPLAAAAPAAYGQATPLGAPTQARWRPPPGRPVATPPPAPCGQAPPLGAPAQAGWRAPASRPVARPACEPRDVTFPSYRGKL